MIDISAILTINVWLLTAISISISIMTLRTDYNYLARLRFKVSVIFGIAGFFSCLSILEILNEYNQNIVFFTNTSMMIFGLGILLSLYYIYKVEKRDLLDIRKKREEKTKNN